MHEQNKNISKDIENPPLPPKKQLELKSTVTEMKYSLVGFKGRVQKTEKKNQQKVKKGQCELSNLRNRKKKKKKRLKKYEQNLEEL